MRLKPQCKHNGAQRDEIDGADLEPYVVLCKQNDADEGQSFEEEQTDCEQYDTLLFPSPQLYASKECAKFFRESPGSLLLWI